jgi:hypothetical protein
MGTASNIIVGVASLEIAYPVGGEYINIGYTKDGVNVEYSSSEIKTEVDEKTMPIDSHIVTEGVKITVNMSESSLYNLDKAIAGSVLSGSVITIGAGATKKMSLRIIGTNPAGKDRTWLFPLVVATGSVGLKYTKKNETIVPVTFEALDSEITMTDTSGESVDVTAATFAATSGAIATVPSFAATVYDHGIIVATGDAWIEAIITDATAETITATALGVTWPLETGVASGHIVIGAADTTTDLVITVTDSGKTAKSYTFHVIRP